MSKQILEEFIALLDTKQTKEIRISLSQSSGAQERKTPTKKTEGTKQKTTRKSTRELVEDNKLLLLFNLLTSNKSYSREVMIKKLYPEKNSPNAYDNLRKRLIKHIQNHLFAQLVTDDKFKVGTVFGMILLAFQLSGQRAKAVMRYLLEKSEIYAIELRLYNVLDGIYDLQEQYAVMLDLDLNEIVRKRTINDALYDKMRKVKRALTEMQLLATEARRQLVFPELSTLIEKALKNQQLTSTDTDNPAIQVRIMSIFRAAYMSSKAYHMLEPLLLERYNVLKQREAFGKGDMEHELSFLYMISHVYYRTSKFNLAGEWLKKMKELLLTTLSPNHIYVLKHKALSAAIYSATGKNELAIECSKEALKQRPKSHEMTEWLNLELSLAVYYFEGKQYRKCIRTLHAISSYNLDLEEELGPEWSFKMDLIGVLAQYENGDPEYALRLIKSMKIKFKDFLGKNQYLNANTFINFITKVIQNPDIVKDTRFRKQLKEISEEWEHSQGHDLQAVRFFCWLKSKMHNRDYYELLVEELAKG